MGIMAKVFGGRGETAEPYLFKELSQQFLGAVAKALADSGFKRRGRSYAFVRPCASGWQGLHFPLSKYTYRFVVMPAANVRFDALETFVNRYAVNRDEKGLNRKSSIGMTLGELAGQAEPSRWSIRSGRDVDKALPEIDRLIRDVGLPYFERFRSLEALYEIVCNQGEQGHIFGNAERAINCVALAHLTSQPDRIPDIVQHWRTVFADTNDASATFFEGFYRSYSQNHA
jgi:hypothetical protein